MFVLRYREDLQARYHSVENDKDILIVKLEQLKSQLNTKEEKYSQLEVVIIIYLTTCMYKVKHGYSYSCRRLRKIMVAW